MEELTEQKKKIDSKFIVKVTDKNNNQVQEKWITTKDIHSELNKLKQSEPEYNYEVVYEYKGGRCNVIFFPLDIRDININNFVYH